MSKIVVSTDDEFEYAKELYTKAIDGLEEHEYPPTPQDWIDNAHLLRDPWNMLKADLMIQMKMDTENAETIKAFLTCTLSVYVDFMSVLSERVEAEEREKMDQERTEVHMPDDAVEV